jgi:hypothetical protein
VFKEGHDGDHRIDAVALSSMEPSSSRSSSAFLAKPLYLTSPRASHSDLTESGLTLLKGALAGLAGLAVADMAASSCPCDVLVAVVETAAPEPPPNSATQSEPTTLGCAARDACGAGLRAAGSSGER